MIVAKPFAQAGGVGLHARRRFAVAGCIGLAAVGLLTGCSSSQPAAQHHLAAPESSYGSLPTFLPSTSLQPDSVLTGSTDRPALTTEGDAVLVDVGTATVQMTVSGPDVPGEGLPYQADATTCTWIVTLSGATAAIGVNVADFTTLDHLGAVYHVAAVAGDPAPPSELQPGQTATFTLRTVMPVGEGLMRWAPDGQHIAASWDFEVEND